MLDDFLVLSFLKGGRSLSLDGILVYFGDYISAADFTVTFLSVICLFIYVLESWVWYGVWVVN